METLLLQVQAEGGREGRREGGWMQETSKKTPH